MSDRDRAGDDSDRDTDTTDFPGWQREHAIDHADYLDALLDPDDPLHDVARRAVDPEAPTEP